MLVVVSRLPHILSIIDCTSHKKDTTVLYNPHGMFLIDARLPLQHCNHGDTRARFAPPQRRKSQTERMVLDRKEMLSDGLVTASEAKLFVTKHRNLVSLPR
jgi:hypothetical protein